MDFSNVITADKIPLLSFATITLIGLVNTIQMTYPQVKGLWGVLTAVGLGLAAGFLHLFGMTPELGLLAGFASSGVYKVSQNFGGLQKPKQPYE